MTDRKFTFEKDFNLKTFLLSSGHDVEVIAPRAFRELIKAEAGKIAGIY